MTSTFRAALAAVAVSAVALLAACAEAPPPPPPAPPPPPVALSAKLIEQASAYRYYLARATAIAPTFADGAAVAESLRTGAAYEPKQFMQGVTAYGAIVALQDPAFVAGVRAYATNPETRRQIAYSIIKDPAYVVGITGANSAAGLVIAALADDGNKFYEAGKAVKQSAYDIQKQSWSKADVPNRDLRLMQAKSLSATPVVGDIAETARLQQAITATGSLGLTGTAATPPFTPVVIRSLAVAALSILGEANDANLETINAVMVEPNTAMCMNMAKLNLYQCLAVAKPHYEDVFCLGQHAMMDTARCVIRASGQPEPYEPKFVPTIAASDKLGYTPSNAKKKPSKKR
jgi:hypothetical protein